MTDSSCLSRTSARSHKVVLLHDSSILPTTNGLPTRTISETNSLKAGKTVQFVLRTRARPVRYMYMYLEDLVSFCFSLYLYTDGQVHVILKRRAAASAIIDSGTFLPGRSWRLKVKVGTIIVRARARRDTYLIIDKSADT